MGSLLIKCKGLMIPCARDLLRPCDSDDWLSRSSGNPELIGRSQFLLVCLVASYGVASSFQTFGIMSCGFPLFLFGGSVLLLTTPPEFH